MNKVIIVDSRMDKYNSDKPVLKKRVERNKDLYKNINDGFIASNFDINSNMTVLNTDSRVIDIDKIRDMLDRKYRMEEPNKKHIIVPKEEIEEVELINTKEYDINSICVLYHVYDHDYDLEQNYLMFLILLLQL